MKEIRILVKFEKMHGVYNPSDVFYRIALDHQTSPTWFERVFHRLKPQTERRTYIGSRFNWSCPATNTSFSWEEGEFLDELLYEWEMYQFLGKIKNGEIKTRKTDR